MTVVAVLAAPPRPGLALPELAADGPLSEAEAADLAGAMLRDTFAAVDASGATLLVNYLPREHVPPEYGSETGPEAELRALAAGALESLDDVRFEPQVGSSFDARAGNTVTHLLREEGADSAAVLRGTTPTLGRTAIDSAAMRLRRASVVLGPAPGGRVHYAVFADPVDFEGAFAPPALSTLTDRARDAGHDVAFLEMTPVVERGGDLLTLVALVRSRQAAGRAVPAHTAAALDDIGLALDGGDGRARVVRA